MRSAANRQLISPAFTTSSSCTSILRRLRAARRRILRLSMSESPRRGAHFRGAMAASEVWSVRRAKEAGEALRPSRTKPCATIPSDRPRPSPRGAPTPSATTTTTGSSGAPIGTVVGLVVARERAAAVYCKRTGETIPRASITLADDTFDGLRVVLWRTHAGADVGARPSPNCWHPPESQPAHPPPPDPTSPRSIRRHRRRRPRPRTPRAMELLRRATRGVHWMEREPHRPRHRRRRPPRS